MIYNMDMVRLGNLKEKMNTKLLTYENNNKDTNVLKNEMTKLITDMNASGNNYKYDPLIGCQFFVLSRLIRDQDSNFTIENDQSLNSITIGLKKVSWKILLNTEDEGSASSIENLNYILLYYFICHQDFLPMLFDKTKPIFKFLGCDKNTVIKKITELQQTKSPSIHNILYLSN